MKVMLNEIWQYSRYYGDLLFTAFRLHNEEEDYAATLVLFNVMELICKSVRENYNQSFLKDLTDLKNKNIMSDENYEFLAGEENGIRDIRNKMMHRDAYQYSFEISENLALPFAEPGTWGFVFSSYAPRIVKIMHETIYNSNQTI